MFLKIGTLNITASCFGSYGSRHHMHAVPKTVNTNNRKEKGLLENKNYVSLGFAVHLSNSERISLAVLRNRIMRKYCSGQYALFLNLGKKKRSCAF